MSECNCCAGSCPECKEIPNHTCCRPLVVDGEYTCVIPAPQNPTTAMPTGARYDCDIFDICQPPAGTFDVEQLAWIEKVIHSILQYFPAYAVNSAMGCPCYTRVYHGRDSTCYERYASPIVELDGGCPPQEPAVRKDCGCGSSSAGQFKFWTPTLPSHCCPKTVTVTDPDTGEETEATYYPKQIFGTVPASHPHWSKYGGQPTPGIGMNQIAPATLEKIVAMFCKVLQVFQNAGPEIVIIEK